MTVLSGVVRSRRVPLAAACALVVLGLVAAAVRLDTPADGTTLELGWSTWHPDGVVVGVPAGADAAPLRDGDVVTVIGGRALADGLGGLPAPAAGDVVAYRIAGAAADLGVPMRRPDPGPLVDAGWGNLVFVVAFAGLAFALFLRRPDEPSTTPLLIGSAGLLGSTLAVVGGLPATALATGGPLLWLFHLNVVGAYSLGWGAMVAFALQFNRWHPWYRGRGGVLAAAYAGPVAIMAGWALAALLIAGDALTWLGLVHAGQTAVVTLVLLSGAVAAVAGYRRADSPLARARLRWLGGGAIAATLVSLGGWQLPELLSGSHPLPSGAVGLAGLPFVVGIAGALRRHRLFDIERLANRSMVYAAVVAVLVVGYAVVVAMLVSLLRVSGTVAAALAAAAAALSLSPLRGAAQGAVNRMMYGQRDDPAGVLDRLGAHLRTVMLPADVAPAVVETVVQSLRVPYAAIDTVDGAGGFRLAAEQGTAVGEVHAVPLVHHGETVGRLRVSARGRDDPLEPVDLALLDSLAQQVGTAVQAVRLHEDLARSRAEVVALREDERRRLRRDLHDGLGPALAAIRLKAALAAREAAPGSAARRLLDEIGGEVQEGLDDIRRLTEALRPPALDELGLVAALRTRAAGLAGTLAIEVSGDSGPDPLPAAVETAAYRIAVEAMTNAVRHSGGQACTVAVRARDHGVTVTVRDDGRGLDPDRTPGVGLHSMRERAAEVGGRCSVRSAADGGTIVDAWLPLAYGGRG